MTINIHYVMPEIGGVQRAARRVRGSSPLFFLVHTKTAPLIRAGLPSIQVKLFGFGFVVGFFFSFAERILQQLA